MTNFLRCALRVVLLASFGGISVAGAAVFTVTNNNDDGPGSLRQAILDSYAISGSNVIEFAISGTPPYVIKPQGQFLPPLKGPVVVRAKMAANTKLRAPEVVLDGSGLVKTRTPDDCPGQTAHYNFQTNRWEYSGARGTGPNVRGYYGAGLAVQDSHDVEISGIEIRNFCIGVATVRSSNVYVHDIKVVDSHGAAGVIFTGDDDNSGSTALSFNNSLVNSVLLDNGDGFEFTRGTHHSLLQGNTIALTQPLPVEGNAVEFATAGDSNAVIGNTFTKYTDTAITISGNNHTISDNKIVENKGSGLRGGGSNLRITGNTISNNGGSGISVSGAGTQVTDNVVSGNAGQGVVIGGPRIRLSRNAIFNNEKLGIDFSAPGAGRGGPPRGDAPRGSAPRGDAPRGGGRGPAEAPDPPNFPVLASTSVWTSKGVTLNGSLDAAPSQTYRVELFASRESDRHAADEKGWGEGELYLGTTSVTTDASGKATFEFTTANPFGGTPTSGFFTATATGATGSTSRFSRALPLTLRQQ